MKCILLAAGYATRLYPLTLNKPKALLELGGKTILEYIIKKIEKLNEVDEIYIVTNEAFYRQLRDWADNYQASPEPGARAASRKSRTSVKRLKVLNDGTTSNENRLGAIADIAYVIDKERLDDDIIVLASDNLFQFELTDLEDFYRRVGHDCIAVHELYDRDELKGTGIAEIDMSFKVTSFEEKPKVPKTNLAVPPIYIYRRDTLKLFDKYLSEGNNPDAPGHFVPWLIGQRDVYAFKFEGLRIDIGTVESYRKVQKLVEDMGESGGAPVF